MARFPVCSVVYRPGPGRSAKASLDVPHYKVTFKPDKPEPCSLPLAVQLCAAARDLYLVMPDGTEMRRPDQDHAFLRKHKLPIPRPLVEEAGYTADYVAPAPRVKKSRLVEAGDEPIVVPPVVVKVEAATETPVKPAKKSEKE